MPFLMQKFQFQKQKVFQIDKASYEQNGLIRTEHLASSMQNETNEDLA